MATELAAVRRAIRDPQSRGVSLCVIGIGKAAAIAGLARIAEADPDAVILAGFCGAVDPNLRTGDLHVAASFHHLGENHSIAANAALSDAILDSARHSGIPVSAQPSATVSAIADASSKAELRRSTAVASVNMEDYWAAAAAKSAGVPFASVRVVLDTADQSLPDYLTEQDVHPAGVALNAAIRPGRLPALVKLGRQSHLARRNLAHCVLATIDALAARQPTFSGVSP